ncbi:hypothetical protein BH11ACT2_BH11ACT2_18810 [soil metagenome]
MVTNVGGMSDEKKIETGNAEPDPTDATTEADVSDGAEQKQKPVDLPTTDVVH